MPFIFLVNMVLEDITGYSLCLVYRNDQTRIAVTYQGVPVLA